MGGWWVEAIGGVGFRERERREMREEREERRGDNRSHVLRGYRVSIERSF